MIAKKLRAVATALVLGTAALAVAAMPADAALRAAVGKPLQEAQALAKQRNYSAALSKVKQAESVGNLTSEEASTINQMKKWLESVADGEVVQSAIGAKAKFNADWRAGKYRQVIADEEMLRRYGALDSTSMVVIAQAYERLGDTKGCVRYADSHASAGADMIKRGLLCAYKAGDDAKSRDLATKLVSMSPTQENWGLLLRQAERAKQLSDPQTRDIYRLKLLTGNMKDAGDYFTLAQMLIAANVNSEAVAVTNKGVEAKLMVDQRAQRLIGMAKQKAAAEAGNVGREYAQAMKSPRGDDLIKVGETLTGMGKYPEAVKAIQAGIAKGVKDKDDAQVRLAVALYFNKQKPQALAALGKPASPNGKMIAQMWDIYIRTSK